ncbi:MAG: aminotransferase class V-fold PLP-dependent enzyme [Treponema sp.]|jgi:cysteine desulfurase family protein|nr:aminotransferase class V-fold PLP-dependent enzyme [Treponema sp.]
MIYANYAATSPALSPAVVKELRDYVGGTHLNAARNFEGLEAGAIALRARKAIGRLFNAADPLKVVFTSGATQSLNMAINGLIRQGDHVLATMVEHNATARPLEYLRKNGVITLDWLPCEAEGSLDAETVRKAIRKNTRLFVMSHASNVLGTILPAAECFTVAREYGIFSVLDMAQTAGVLPVTTGTGLADVIAFTGHKGLGGLAGIGGFVIGEEASREMRPWASGGTGSVSGSLDMPEFLPDKFEPGTQNTIGILSLAVSVEEILRIGVEKIREREQSLTERFIGGLEEIQKITLYGPREPDRRVAPVSVVVQGYDAGEASRFLFEKYGIITRSGLHCSPLAHKTAGTYPAGTVRFSFGRETREAEIDAALEALSQM